MNNYEVSDVFEVGNARSLIRDKDDIFFDEIAGVPGPVQEDLDSD